MAKRVLVRTTRSRWRRAIGDRLRELREQRGLSSVQLGEMLGTPNNTVCRREVFGIVRLDDLPGYARAFGIENPKDVLPDFKEQEHDCK